MSKRPYVYGVLAAGSLIMFVMLLIDNYDCFEIQQQSMLSQKSSIQSIGRANGNVTLRDIQEVMEIQRKVIKKDMKDYHYPNGNYGINVTKLEDLVMESGGRPMRNIVLTYWRSGSTFFGELLNAHPGNFYHYEPLLDFGVVQVRGPPLAEPALRNLKALLNCEYEDMDNYLSSHEWSFNHNTNLWRYCEANQKLCLDTRFLNGFCKLFPFQSMKILRLRLRLAEQLLEDTNLAVRLVLLVRDPRGMVQSRKNCDWCLPENKDCSNPALLCVDMVDDFRVAVELMKTFPTRFRVIRYEDLAMEPYKYAKELYNFYGLDSHPNVREFLDSHTNNNDNDTYGTSRDSKSTPFQWRSHLEFQEVEEIQRSCAAAMQYWGYVPAMNATHQMNLNPIIDYQMKL